ncbi:MAG: TolC family protein [Tannerellaceae bacterium]|nr:TolC family protein [Tannerellaceae bacterium]
MRLSALIETAFEYRPDLQIAGLQTSFFEKSLAYEKAQRVPDLTVQGNYDRFGGVWKDFIGFGISIDLPVFNRNQGNIKATRIQIEQSIYQAQMQQNIVQNEIAEAYANYTAGYDFYRKIVSNPLLDELDNMRKAYDRNLIERHISMMEFIDFSEAWMSNKQTLLNAIKNMALQQEELQYVIGTDIK